MNIQHIFLCRLAKHLFERFDEFGKLCRRAVSDIHRTPWGDGGKIICGAHGGFAGDCIHQATYSIDEIINIGEITQHIAVIIHIDGAVVLYGISKFKQRHIRSPPWAINRKEAEHRRWNIVEMRIGLRHRLGRLFGRRIKGHLSICSEGFAVGHVGVGAVNRRCGGDQQMLGRVIARGFQHFKRTADVALHVAARFIN